MPVTEEELAARAIAPRISEVDVDAAIAHKHFLQPSGTTLTICILTLVNGFHVIGQSAAASPENFDAGIGNRLAYTNARNKIWELEGYRLRSELHAQGK